MRIASVTLFPADGPIKVDLGEYTKHGEHLSVTSTIENGVLHLVIDGPKKKSEIYGVPFELSFGPG
jgi:hypothetical protein